MKILFQGDSITDAGRDRRNYHDMGNGYPKYAAISLQNAFPKVDFEFINMGISGNRTDQLFDRIYTDAITFQPDIISILIGINDVWHRHNPNRIETSEEQIEANYRSMLKLLRQQTNAKIVIIAPYLLDFEPKEAWREEVKRVVSIVSRLADEYADVYIPLDQHFETALKTQPTPLYYSADGVHPNQNGAEFIANQYFEAVSHLIQQLSC
ncbi:MAG: GDSL family lipase [Clostridia bacterium]|nr:GDSL family lipase [Clostridia bacterium]